VGSNVARKGEGVGRLGCGALDGAGGVVGVDSVGLAGGGFEANGKVPVNVNDGIEGEKFEGVTEGSGGVEASATEDVMGVGDASDGDA